MLNFENMRLLTDKMKNLSFAYAENFLQKVFDSMKFNEDYTFADGYEVCQEYFPDGADPNDFFEYINFTVEYDCSGTLKVFIQSDDFNGDESLKYLIIQEVLLKNGFVKIEKEHWTTFIRVI